jgi:hypothetical protein
MPIHVGRPLVIIVISRLVDRHDAWALAPRTPHAITIVGDVVFAGIRQHLG